MDETNSKSGKWQCDGCGVEISLSKNPAEVLYGQTRSGGFSIQFCYSFAQTRKRWQEILVNQEFTSFGRII